MWRCLSWPALGVLLVAGVGCSSPLEEYVCSSSDDCSSGFSTSLSRCEPSGHCSFLDPSCSQSGFRFGDGAGSESGTCVGGSGGAADAGPDENRPVASIGFGELEPCRTNLIATTEESTAFGGATLTAFTWTVRDENDDVIDSFTGAPTAPIPRGTHRRAGTFARPNVNFPEYHGRSALQASLDGILRTSIFQQDIDLAQAVAGANFRVFFSVAVEVGQSVAEERVGVVRLRTAAGNGLVEAPFTLQNNRFVGHQFDLTREQVLDSGAELSDLGKLTLEFEFAGTGMRWLDNVALVNLETGQTRTFNETVEIGPPEPWLLGDGETALAGLFIRDIPAVLQSREFYTLSLQVTDSNGLRSDEDELTVFVDACP